MPTTKRKPSLDIYHRLGWKLNEPEGGEAQGTCPFCGKHKMYVSQERCFYHCKVCSASGNVAKAIEETWKKWREKPHKKALIRLAKYRGLPLSAFKLDDNLAYNPEEKTYWWIVRNKDGVAQTIRKTKKLNDGKLIISTTKGLPIGLLGVEELKSNTKEPVYIVEGEWDRIALKYFLLLANKPGVVIAQPGASAFKREWAKVFTSRKVYLVFDKDEVNDQGVKPGEEGASRTAKIIRKHTHLTKFLAWDESLPDNYDVHDHVKEAVKEEPEEGVENYWKDKFAKFYEWFVNRAPGEEDFVGEDGKQTYDEKEEAQKKLDPISVEKLHETFHKHLELENCDLLDIVMGCTWAMNLPGNPLWLFVVSPPSGSKSETLIPVSEYHKCRALSNISSKGLISGFSLSGGADPSLFAELENEVATIIIKDFTPLLEGNETEREEVFGLMRDAYDGSSSKVFGNGIKREYTGLKFNLIAGVTPAIDGYGGVAMGERFLKFRADKELGRSNDEDRALRAILNCGNETEMREELSDACVRSLIRPFKKENVPKPTIKDAKAYAKLGAVISACRSAAPVNRFTGTQESTPVKEVAARLATQFIKLAQGLALHFELTDLLDPKIFRLVCRVGLHTPSIINMRVIQALYEDKTQDGLTVKQIVNKLGKVYSFDTVRSVLIGMSYTGLVFRIESEETTGLWGLEQQTKEDLEVLKLFEELPKSDPMYRKQKFIIKPKRKTNAKKDKEQATLEDRKNNARNKFKRVATKFAKPRRFKVAVKTK